VIKTSYLRVYLPAERDGSWPAHADRADHAVIYATERFVWEESMTEDALTVDWNGASYQCPRFPRLRMLEGLLAFSNSFPAMPLLTEGERSAYAEELAEIRKGSTRARSHILASPWHVPLRWFAAFQPSDREIYDLADGISIRYRTSIGDAVDRVGWGARVLDEVGFSESVVEQVRDLERWIVDFPANAMIELDYSDVAALFSDGEVAFDESAVEVRRSLEALERGDMDEAGEAYMMVATRWAQRQALAFSN
jgi:hypothetical protein